MIRDDIEILKRGRNDNYAQIQIIREETGRVLERLKAVEFFAKHSQLKSDDDEDEKPVPAYVPPPPAEIIY